MPGASAAVIAAAGTPVVSLLPSYTAQDAQLSPTQAVAAFQLTNTGLVYTYAQGVDTPDGAWITPVEAAGAAYEVRVTLDSGDTPSGTLNTWLGLDVSYFVFIETDGVGAQTRSSNLTVEIRDAASMTVLATTTVLLIAEELI